MLRASSPQGFTAAERRRLRALSPLLFSILEQHLNASRAACCAAETATSDNLMQRFDERLRQTGLNLSERETQVCLGLLTCFTAREQAERLRLTVNTVCSYQRRAAQKLGISGRRALRRWLYESDFLHAGLCPSTGYCTVQLSWGLLKTAWAVEEVSPIINGPPGTALAPCTTIPSSPPMM